MAEYWAVRDLIRCPSGSRLSCDHRGGRAEQTAGAGCKGTNLFGGWLPQTVEADTMATRSNWLSPRENDGFGADTPFAPLTLFDAALVGADTVPDDEGPGNEGPETGAAPSQIVFIEGNVPDAEELARGVKPGVRVVLLDPSLDGVRQIADYLTGHDIQNLAAIDIVAHGADGLLDLGTAELNAATIGQYQGELAAIGAALRP